MKKKIGLILVCCLSLVLVACGGGGDTHETVGRDTNVSTQATTVLPKAQRQEPSLWTYPELNELNEQQPFVPTTPQMNDYILVESKTNRFENKSPDVITENEMVVQMGGTRNLLLQLQNMQAISNPEDTLLNSYYVLLQNRGQENIPLTMAIDPNCASILLEYRVSYPSYTEYAQEGKEDAEKKVKVYDCQLDLTAYDAKTGEKLGTVSFINNAKGNINVIEDSTTEVYREVPTLYGEEDAKKLTDFLFSLSNH